MVFQEDIVMFIKKVISLLIATSMVILPGIALADDDVEVVDSIILDGEAEYDVPLESAPSLDAISAANSSAALLANHYSVASYVLNYTYSGGQTYTSESMTALVATDGVPAYYESTDALDIVYDGENRYLIYPNGEKGVNICFDDNIKNYYDGQISAYSLYTHLSGENLISCKQQGSNYILTSTITHGDYSNATGRDYDLDDSVPIEIKLVADIQTLELSQWSAVAHPADGIDIQLTNGSATYDSTPLPADYYAMSQPETTRAITIITNPASTQSTETVFTIADGALPYVIAPDGYTLAVMNDNQQFVEPDDGTIPATGDYVLYLIPEN